jgi:predicted transcriptional regulator
MPRNYTSKRERQYTPEELQQAVSEAKKGHPLSSIAREFSIPRNTIRDHLRSNVKVSGGQTIFYKAQEDALCERVLHISYRGFPVTIAQLRQLAFQYAKKLHRRGKL